jgi:hypothetical protein
MNDLIPDGFILSESALYAYKCQDIYHDIISFAAAIPDNLKPLFLIPIKLETATTSVEIASRVASMHYADGAIPTGGDTEDAELFGTKTFVYDDNQPTIPSSDPGSIFDIDCADEITHHQEYNYDENIQVPTETTFMEDVDITQYQKYPYRTDESPVRHSSIKSYPVMIMKLALKPEIVIPHTPDKIKKNAHACTVSLVSYDKKTRIFTFSVDAGNGAKTVRAALSDIDDVALSCDCPFWRYNGPEFNAKTNKFMLGQPYGRATPPDVRDPERQYWLCKHAYAVLKRLDHFIQEVIDENWEMDDSDLLEEVDKEWDRLEGTVQIPLEKAEEIDIDINFEEPTEEETGESSEEQEQEQVYDYDEVPIYIEGPEGEDILFDYDKNEYAEGPPLEKREDKSEEYVEEEPSEEEEEPSEEEEEPEVTYDYSDEEQQVK